ncbi:TadE/TadG family type IV pilus assembly protein [Dactylosporangium sp. NPDC051485]|uniref:TadE/TadG family type IV pilus assembly protein n=1 Tax=Dactylosporangium sp. NPDC051485 TaxID=3154846 RepID=UPI003441BF80
MPTRTRPDHLDRPGRPARPSGPGTGPRPRRRTHRRHNDRGAVTVEFALAVPLLVFIVVVLTQVFMWGMGYLAAHAAADHAAQTTRVVGGTAAAGQTDAEDLLAGLGGDFIADRTVTVTRTAQTTTVRITGHARGVPVPIVVTVQLPTERYTT